MITLCFSFIISVWCVYGGADTTSDADNKARVPLFFVSEVNNTLLNTLLAKSIMDYVVTTGWPVRAFNFDEEDGPHPDSKLQHRQYVEWLRTGVRVGSQENAVMCLCRVPSLSTFHYAFGALGNESMLDPYYVLFDTSPIHEQALMSKAVEAQGTASHVLLVPTDRYADAHSAAGAILSFIGQKTGRFHFAEVTKHVHRPKTEL